MKKLMITLSAAALAFGAFADGALIAGENFNGKALTDLTAWSGLTADTASISSTPYSFSQETDVGAPNEYRETQALDNLVLKTPFNAPAFYSLGSPQALNTQMYFDALVKFTACDEDPDASAFATGGAYYGSKLMVWIKEVEGENNVSQHLMITAGKLDNELNPTLQHYDCGAPSAYNIGADGDWCRLTIKAVKDITDGSYVTGFVVFINGLPVTIDTPKDIGIAQADLNKVMAIWAKNNRLFPSLVASDSTITEVGFAGQGAVDDVCFTTVEPNLVNETQFALDPVPAIATIDGQDATSVAAINNALASKGCAVVLLDNISGDLTFTQVGNTLDLNGFTLTGSVLSTGDATLTISDTVGTGVVEGMLWPDFTSPKFVIAGGKFSDDATTGTPSIADVADPAEGYEFTKDGNYWTVAEISEDGTTAKPWKIGSAADLQNKLLAYCAADKDAAHMNFIMTDNIDLTDTVWDGPGESRTATGAFTGVFDGQGYTISNLTLAKKEYNGFFGCLAGTAQVKNLTILVAGFGGDAPSDGSYGAAGAVGFSMGTDVLVENVTVKGQASDTVLSGTHNVGGVCCRLEGKITVKNCTNELNIASTYTKIAGICPIAAIRDAAGAIVFDGCVNKGNVTGIGTNNAGRDGCSGILGYIEGDKPLTIKNCGSYGTFTSESTNAKKASIFSDPYKYVATEISGNKATANVAAYGNRDGKTVDGLNYAVVDGDVATFVANSAVVAGGSYKVMSPTVKAFSITLAKGETIAFDKALSSEFVATVTPAEGCKVTTQTTGTVTTYTCAELKKATAPTAATGLTYTGKEQTGVAEGEGYTLTGDTTAVNAGEYTATATLAEGYDQWSDGTTEAKTIPWLIAKATTTITTAPTASAEIEKDAALKTIDLVGGVASTAGTFAWTEPETTVDADGEFSVTFTPEDTTNYDTATCTVAVKVKTGGGEYPSDWPETDPETKAKYATWAAGKGAGSDPELPATQEAFLMNCSPAELEVEKAAFKITAFDGTKASIITPTANTKGDAFNGTIVTKAYSDAACTTEVTVPTGEEAGLFYRAVLTFPQPAE